MKKNISLKEFRSNLESWTYRDLLRKWRFADSGDPYFQGEKGKIYREVMKNKEANLQQGEKAQISKSIGW